MTPTVPEANVCSNVAPRKRKLPVRAEFARSPAESGLNIKRAFSRAAKPSAITIMQMTMSIGSSTSRFQKMRIKAAAYLSSSSIITQTIIILEPLQIPMAAFWSGKAMGTTAMPAMKLIAMRRYGSGWLLSSRNQNHNQNRAGVRPAKKAMAKYVDSIQVYCSKTLAPIGCKGFLKGDIILAMWLPLVAQNLSFASGALAR